MNLFEVLESVSTPEGFQLTGSRAEAAYATKKTRAGSPGRASQDARLQARYEKRVRAYNALPASQRGGGGDTGVKAGQKISTKGFAPATRAGAKKAAKANKANKANKPRKPKEK